MREESRGTRGNFRLQIKAGERPGQGRAEGGAARHRQTRGGGKGQTSLPETMGHFPFGGQEGASQEPGSQAEGIENERSQRPLGCAGATSRTEPSGTWKIQSHPQKTAGDSTIISTQ